MLPEYMKLIYQELVNIHVEMEESLEKEGKTYQIHCVKEMVNYIFFDFEFHDLDKYNVMGLSHLGYNTGKRVGSQLLGRSQMAKRGVHANS